MDVVITQMSQKYQEYDFETHFGKLQAILVGEDIALTCGANVLSNIEYNDLDVC